MRDALAYRDQLQGLLPSGAAWRGEMLGQLLHAFAEEPARLDGRAVALLEEADPLTALELLPDWERAVGLPDPCTPISDSVRERQLAVARRLAGIGGQTRDFFVELAALVGLEVEVEEFQPFAAGSLAGDPAYDDDWRFAFAIVVLPESLQAVGAARVDIAFFTAGQSSAGDPLHSFGSTSLECVVSRARPAHSEVIFIYQFDPEPMLWFDFTTGTGE